MKASRQEAKSLNDKLSRSVAAMSSGSYQRPNGALAVRATAAWYERPGHRAGERNS